MIDLFTVPISCVPCRIAPVPQSTCFEGLPSSSPVPRSTRDGPRTRRTGNRTSARPGTCSQEYGAFHGFDDIQQRDFFRGLCRPDSARLSPPGSYQPGAGKVHRNLPKKILGNLPHAGDLGDGNRRLGRLSRQMDHRSHCVFSRQRELRSDMSPYLDLMHESGADESLLQIAFQRHVAESGRCGGDSVSTPGQTDGLPAEYGPSEARPRLGAIHMVSPVSNPTSSGPFCLKRGKNHAEKQQEPAGISTGGRVREGT